MTNEQSQEKVFISFAGCGVIWIVFEVVIALMAIATYFIPIPYATGVAISFFLLTNAITLRNGFYIMREKHELVIEIFGKYEVITKTGLYLIFPWFKIVVVKHLVYTGEIMLHLYTEDKNGKEIENKVDFQDASAKVIAVAYIKLVDTLKATYEIENVLRGVREKLDGALRSYMGGMEIQQANKHRVALDKTMILQGIDIEEVLKLSEEEKGNLKNKKSDLEDEIAKWGVEIVSLAVSDIVIDELDEEARRQLLEAENEAQAIMKKAEAEAKAIERIASALAQELQNMQESGKLSPNEAAQYIQKLKLYKELSNTGANVIIGSQVAEIGATFGAGFNAKQKTEGE